MAQHQYTQKQPALATLVSSNGKAIDSWPSKKQHVQPTVILAIVSAVANAALRYALAESVTIIWWKKALSGQSLKDLHLSWAHATSFKKALLSGKSFSTIALACIITSIVSIDGPILQRASAVVTRSVLQNTTVTASLFSDELPRGYSGIYRIRTPNVTALTPKFAEVVKNYQSRTDMTLGTTGCEGVCNTNVLAPGFDVQCTEGTEPYNLSMVIRTHTADPTTANIGGVSFSFNQSEPGRFNASVRYKRDSDCIGLLQTVNCSFNLATVSYPITITNSSVQLRPSGPNDTVKLQYPYVEYPGLGTTVTTVGGFVLIADQLFGSNITMQGTAPFWTIMGEGTMKYAYMSNDEYQNCTITYSNPMPDIRSTLRELIFRATLSLSNSTTNQTAPGTSEFQQTVFTLNYYYLVAGMCVILANVFAILPLFLGWWDLGREFSMSPLEIAKAFQSPMLAQAGSNEKVGGLVKAIGEKRVRYGAIVATDTRNGVHSGRENNESPELQSQIGDFEGNQELNSSEGQELDEDQDTDEYHDLSVGQTTAQSHGRETQDASEEYNMVEKARDERLILCLVEEGDHVLRPEHGTVYQ